MCSASAVDAQGHLVGPGRAGEASSTVVTGSKPGGTVNEPGRTVSGGDPVQPEGAHLSRRRVGAGQYQRPECATRP